MYIGFRNSNRIKIEAHLYPQGGPSLVPLEGAIITGVVAVVGREVAKVMEEVFVCDTEGVIIVGVVLVFIYGVLE